MVVQKTTLLETFTYDPLHLHENITQIYGFVIYIVSIKYHIHIISETRKYFDHVETITLKTIAWPPYIRNTSHFISSGFNVSSVNFFLIYNKRRTLVFDTCLTYGNIMFKLFNKIKMVMLTTLERYIKIAYHIHKSE